MLCGFLAGEALHSVLINMILTGSTNTNFITSDDDDFLPSEQFLGDNRSKSAIKVTPTVNYDWFFEHGE